MRRFFVFAVAGLALGGCSSLSGAFKSEPPTVAVQLDSTPQGADALTSTGQSCKTPCSITVPPGDFTVTFSMAKFQPATVPVAVSVTEGSLMSPGTASASPNPVTAELQPAKPVRARKPGPRKPRKPKAATAAPAAEAPAATSPFPAPAAAPAR